MSKTIPILGIVAVVTAILAALVFFDIALLLPALVAIGFGITLTISKDYRQIIPGVCAIVFGIVGIMGILGNVSTEDGGVNFGISAGVGQALIIVALLEIAGASVVLTWQELEPEWLSYVLVALWAICFILAFVVRDGFTTQNSGAVYGLVVPMFLFLAAPILHLREA